MKKQLILSGLIFITAAVAWSFAVNSEYTPVWNQTTGGWVRSIGISRDGEFIAAGSEDTRIHMFNKTGGRLWSYQTGSYINSVALTNDGSYVAGASDDTNVYFFDRNGTVIWRYDTGSKAVGLVSISLDGEYIAASTEYPDSKIYFLNKKGAFLWSYKLVDVPRGLSVSSNGSYVAAGSKDGTIYLFDRDGRVVWTRLLKSTVINDVSLSDDASNVFIAHSFGNLSAYSFRGLYQWSTRLDGEGKRIFNLDDGTIAVQTDDKKLVSYSEKGVFLGSVSLDLSINYLSISGDARSMSASFQRPDFRAYLYNLKVIEPAPSITPAPPQEPRKVVVLANSIDRELASDFYSFLSEKGFFVIKSSASEFGSYRNESKIVVLGGPDAPEGVGSIASGVLTLDEQEFVRADGNKGLFKHKNPWNKDGVVIVLAGSDRFGTRTAHTENRDRVALEL